MRSSHAITIAFLGMGLAIPPPPTRAGPLPDVAWSFPPSATADHDKPADSQKPFDHLPAKAPEDVWQYMARVDLTDPAAIQAVPEGSVPQPPDRPAEPPLDRPPWVAGTLLESLYRDILAGKLETSDQITESLKKAKSSRNAQQVEALEMMRALANLQAGRLSVAKAQFAEQKKCLDPQLRAYAMAYCEVLKSYPGGVYEQKNLADWITVKAAGPSLVEECLAKVQRKAATTLRDPTEGPHALLRKSADNLERLKDSLRMLDILQTGRADDLIAGVCQHEHDIRLAVLEADVRTLQTRRQELVAAAGAIKPRIGLNPAAREMSEMLKIVDYVPVERVREHNQLVLQLYEQWAQALRSQRAFDRFLAVAGNRLTRPVSRKERESLARTIWSAPYVDDLGAEIKEYYHQKSRPQGRVFFALKEAAEDQPRKTSR